MWNFLFDSKAQCSLLVDNERIGLANGEISVVLMIKDLLVNGTVSKGCDAEQEAPSWGNGGFWG